MWIWNHIIYKPIAFFNQRSNTNHKLSTNFAVKIQVPTFSNGMWMSLKVSLGVSKAVSNSSTVNSFWIFNSGLKTCSSKKQKLKSQNATICKNFVSGERDWTPKAYMQEIEYGRQFPLRAEGPTRQLRGRRLLNQRGHDLAALLLLRRLVVLQLLFRLRLPLGDWLSRQEPLRSANGASPRGSVPPRRGLLTVGRGRGRGLVLGNKVIVSGIGVGVFDVGERLRGGSVAGDRRRRRI